MGEEPKISMWREVGLGLDLMIEQTVGLPKVVALRIFKQFLRWPVAFKKIIVWSLVGGIAVAILGFLSTEIDVDSVWFTNDHWKDGRSEVVRNFGLLVAAIFGLAIGVWRSWSADRASRADRIAADADLSVAKTGNDQARIAEQGQITDRYTKAIEMLSASEARTRIGAIYALSRIAQDSPDRDFAPVMDTLCEFVRNPPYREEGDALVANWKEAAEADEAGADPEDIEVTPAILCPDVHAAIKAINSLAADPASPEYLVDFDHAVLIGLNLDGVDFSARTLVRAEMSYSSLRGATLSRADLSRAILWRATLSRADLSRAILWRATLSRANLRGATLNGAILSRAILNGANLNGATLSDAILSDADLIGVHDLTQSQIDRVKASAPPRRLPPDIEWPFEEVDGIWVRKKE